VLDELVVSVLFSEPKIPQSHYSFPSALRKRGFSALQRAENSSIQPDGSVAGISRPFQCSSASRKFLNASRVAIKRERQNVSVLFSEPKIPQSRRRRPRRVVLPRFSALQRAENSSIPARLTYPLRSPRSFSALQRAENSSMQPVMQRCGRICVSFSALQRAENSSIRP